MSFKYRLILFYIIVEVFFITLIVGVNFTALNNASKKLIDEKVSSNITLIKELIKVPLSIYDLATLDNLVEKILIDEEIDAIIIFDNQKNRIAGKNNYKNFTNIGVSDFVKNDEIKLNDQLHLIKYEKIYEDDILLGSFGIIFDLEGNQEFIDDNRIKTLILILFEIAISFIVSYYLGTKLTRKLELLSDKTKEIGENKYPKIPYTNLSDEIGTLAKSIDKMQKDLKIRNENIIQIQKQKDSFFANISHELKTPLNSINIISSVMLKNKSNNLNETELKNMELINRCGKDLLLLINDILDISKLEAGQIRLNCESFNIDTLLQNILHMFENEASNKNINLLYKNDSNIQQIFNDDIRIKQIIVNLISNAIKFTDEGTIEIILNDLNENLEILVKDKGIGIPENKLESIFERFKQVDAGTSRKYGGTGLGLAICKELTKLLNGDITVTSELGKGSVFRVVIQKNIHIDKNLYETKNSKDINLEKLEDVRENKDKLEDETILFLNKDYIEFMQIVVELKRRAKGFVQQNDISFINEKSEVKFDILIINFENFDLDEILFFISKVNYKKLVIICENESLIQDNIKEKTTLICKKPLDKNHFIEKLSNI